MVARVPTLGITYWGFHTNPEYIWGPYQAQTLGVHIENIGVPMLREEAGVSITPPAHVGYSAGSLGVSILYMWGPCCEGGGGG